MKRQIINKIFVFTLSVLMCRTCMGATEAPQENKATLKSIDGNCLLKITIPDLTTVDEEKTELITDKIQEQRDSIGDSLIQQIEANYNKLTNNQVSNLIDTLGTMRYAKAVPILIKYINFERMYIPKDAVRVGNIIVGSMSPLESNIDLHPSNTALIQIGAPASKYIFSIINEKPSDMLTADYLSSRINGFVEVLYQVEGPRYGLLKLQDRQKEATDPKVKAQYQLVIDKFKEILKQTP